jgi:hypothetical protein
MADLESICMLTDSSIFWKKHPDYREPLEVLADNEILERVDFIEVFEKSHKAKLVKEPDIYEASYRYKLVKGYKVNYNNHLSVVNDLLADKLEMVLKKANIDYNRRDDYLSIEESWDQIESSSYMHIRIIK